MAREAAHAAQWIDALDLSRTEAAYSIRSQFFSCPATGIQVSYSLCEDVRPRPA
jgi:hypothetical protein